MMNHSSNLTSPSNIAFCSAIFPDGVLPPKRVVSLIVLCVVNALSSAGASTANALVLWAIKKTPSLHNPSSALLCVLASLDLTVGVFIQPLAVMGLIGLLTDNYPVFCITGTIGYPVGLTLGGLSFVTIAAISVDRYLALALHLRYAQIVTVSCVITCVLPIIAFLFILTIMSFWFLTKDWFRITIACVCFLVTASCIFVIPFVYCRIFAILRRHKKQIHDQTAVATRKQGCSQTNLSKYRRSVSAILYVLLAIILSYLPCLISFVIAWRYYTESSRLVLRFTGTVLLLNSFINPLVYCWRKKEIRRFVALKLRRVFGVSDLMEHVIPVEEVNPK